MIDTMIIHGSFGSPFQNWAPWLHSELTEIGQIVVVPHFTSGSLQNLGNWTRIMDGYADLIDENTSIVAHSLGPAFVVDWLISNGKSIDKLVCVAPFYGLLDIKDFDEVNKSFFVDGINLSEAKRLVQKTVCIFADNDPYVPITLSHEFASALAAETIVVEGGGHLNSGAGYEKFSLLLETLK